MPIKDPEERKAWYRAYRRREYKRKAEEKKEKLLLWYQNHLDARRQKNTTNNRAAGRKPRVPGPLAQPEVIVSTSKRYRFLNGKIYFTSKRGFEIKELREILRLVTQK